MSAPSRVASLAPSHTELAFALGEVLFRLGDQRLHPLCISQQTGALRGQEDLVPSSVKQPHAKIFFERLDLQRHSRLRNQELLRRFTEAQLLRHGAKHLQPEILQLRHASHYPYI